MHGGCLSLSSPWLLRFRQKVFTQALGERETSPVQVISWRIALGRSLILSELVLSSCYFPSVLYSLC